MVASPWKFLVGLTRRHGKESKRASVEDASDRSIADEMQEPAQLQPPAAPALSTDGAQDTADQVDADSHASDDVPDIEKVVEEPTGPDKFGLEQVDDRASTTGLGLQTDSVEVSATAKPRKARAFRKKNASAKIQSTPSTRLPFKRCPGPR